MEGLELDVDELCLSRFTSHRRDAHASTGSYYIRHDRTSGVSRWHEVEADSRVSIIEASDRAASLDESIAKDTRRSCWDRIHRYSDGRASGSSGRYYATARPVIRTILSAIRIESEGSLRV